MFAGGKRAEVTIQVEIQAHLPDGAPEDVVRTVKENGRTLKFRECELKRIEG